MTRVDGRAEGKVDDARRAGGGVDGDFGDDFTRGIAEAKAGEIVNGKEGRLEKGRGGSGFNGGIVSTAWDVMEGRDEFGGAVDRCVLFE